MNFGENILDLLSSTISKEISISGLSNQLKEKGFSGDYKNTYQKIMQFEKENLITTKQIGNSKALTINYNNPKNISKLAMMELAKKIEFIEKNPKLSQILTDLTKIDSEFIALSDSQKSIKLNRIELLILTKNPLDTLKKCNKIQDKISIRIDCLALKKIDFIKLIKYNNTIIPKILSNKIILSNQEHYFEFIGNTLKESNLSIKKYDFTDLIESELRYNLSKFGYSEFGAEQGSKDISFEEAIIATLMLGTARQKTALNELIARNDFSSELLFFLAKKYSKQNELKIITQKIKSSSKLDYLNKLLLH